MHGRRSAIKFDWIDFGPSLKEPEARKLDKLLHNSTSSLLAKHLRGRDAPFSKIFCWLRSDEGVFEGADTSGVRHLEATFPFDAYDTRGADHLAIFADWLVRTVATGAPELGIDRTQCSALAKTLSAEEYTYTRVDKLKAPTGQPKCEIRYQHTPWELVITVNCKLEDGRTITRTLREHPFARDELVYGKAITRCSVHDGDRLALESFLGTLLAIR